MLLYADTSALAKLVLVERESAALRRRLGEDDVLVSSALVIAELLRATRRLRPELEQQAQLLLETVVIVDVDREILAVAAALAPADVRTLDAIHVATALALGEQLDAVLTYDARMIDAARGAGLTVEAPGA